MQNFKIRRTTHHLRITLWNAKPRKGERTHLTICRACTSGGRVSLLRLISKDRRSKHFLHHWRLGWWKSCCWARTASARGKSNGTFGSITSVSSEDYTESPRKRAVIMAGYLYSHVYVSILFCMGEKLRGYALNYRGHPRNWDYVVKIHPDVKHWHGAILDSWFAHISISTNSQKGGCWMAGAGNRWRI